MNSQEPGQYLPPYYQDDEITLKELILKLQEFALELWSHKIWICIGALLVGGIFVGKTFLQKTYYTASLNFMVTENTSNKGGFSPYGTLDYSGVSNNKVTELARSGRIIYQVLLTKSVVNGKNDFLGNHLINIYNLHGKWENEPLVEQYKGLHLKDFYFVRTEIDSFSQKEKRALSVLHELVSGSSISKRKGLLSINYSKDSEIFNLKVKALDENISIQILDALFAELREFYVEETIGKPKMAYDILSAQTDSLSTKLLESEESLAFLKDRNRNVISSLSAISIGQKTREVNLLSQEYESSLRNLKQLELLLSQETPEFAVIDRTFFPKEEGPAKRKSLLLGLFLGGFLVSAWVLGKKIVKDAMATG